MRRLEIRRFEPEWPAGQNPYVLILQARDCDVMGSVIAAPLERRKRSTTLTDYELDVAIDGEPFVILIQELAAQPKRDVGELASTANHLEWEIGKALDRLLFGV